jgi:carboxypeptidase Q
MGETGMSLRRKVIIATFILAGTLASVVVRAQMAPQAKSNVLDDATLAADDKIIAEINDHNEIMSNLEYLSDMIGQRLTGSENLKKANDWTKERFAAYGVDNPHLESWQIAHTWTRGTARGRILSPAEHPLSLASYAWAPGTNGVVRGPIVYVKAQSIEELQAYKGKLKNAFVIMSEPLLLPPPDEPAPNPMLIPYGDSTALVAPKRPGAPVIRFGPEYMKFVQDRNAFFKEEGINAWLTDSGKPDTLLNMTGLGGRTYSISPVPAAFVTSENYSLIWRLLKRGPVEAEIEITNTIGDAPADVYNTVAEIRGSEKPDEIVVLGAHLDSWDMGTGTTDNGAGVASLMEAARALQKLGLKPKRTIRFILFSGEEQGLCGSRAYVEAHKSEMPKISAMLVQDIGTGKVLSIGMMENFQDAEIMYQVVKPLKAVGLLESSEKPQGGSDHVSFNQAGVPGFYGIQAVEQYFQTHHSQADTFDQAKEPGLIQGAQVMAVWAYNVAQLADLLPRKPAPPEAAH